MHCAASSGSIKVSVVVPALNEAANLPALMERIDAALVTQAYEVIVVDDGSTDGTPNVCTALATRFPLRLHVRPLPSGGLSGAVLDGLRLAKGQYLAVMDADLQHPPERLPDLIDILERDQADFVVGSRYVRGGSTAAEWNWLRRINSLAATLLARPFAGRMRDPMSGFFALRRETFERARDLEPMGYKIALELMCKCGVSRLAEVPIHFDARREGASKLTVAQQVKYLEHLSRLYDFAFPRLSPLAKFVIATACAWFVAFSFYVRLVAHDVGPAAAPPIAFAAAVFTSSLFHSRAVRRAPFAARPWRDFALVSAGEWAVCTAAAVATAYHLVGSSAVEIFLLTFGFAAAARYLLRATLLRNLNGFRRLRAESLTP